MGLLARGGMAEGEGRCVERQGRETGQRQGTERVGKRERGGILQGTRSYLYIGGYGYSCKRSIGHEQEEKTRWRSGGSRLLLLLLQLFAAVAVAAGSYSMLRKAEVTSRGGNIRQGGKIEEGAMGGGGKAGAPKNRYRIILQNTGT